MLLVWLLVSARRATQALRPGPQEVSIETATRWLGWRRMVGLQAVWSLCIPLNQSAVFANQGRPGFVEPVEINKGGAGCVEQSFLRLECLSLTVRAANLPACCLITSRSKRLCEAFGSCFQCASNVFHNFVVGLTVTRQFFRRLGRRVFLCRLFPKPVLSRAGSFVPVPHPVVKTDQAVAERRVVSRIPKAGAGTPTLGWRPESPWSSGGARPARTATAPSGVAEGMEAFGTGHCGPWRRSIYAPLPARGSEGTLTDAQSGSNTSKAGC